MSERKVNPTLHRQKSVYADPEYQLEVLQDGIHQFPSFDHTLQESGIDTLRAESVDILQINLGYMCNLTCKHCHVDAGPDRKEKMSMTHLKKCLQIIDENDISTVDLTGGAPEMHPYFCWFVEELSKRDVHIIDRCNLTIILANKKYRRLPEFFAEHGVEVISSLPHYTSRRTDNQRGDGVFQQSIDALQMLNAVGYGVAGSELQLNLVYNPVGAFLPDSQADLEPQFKRRLMNDYGITFNNLYTITNMPIARYLEYLKTSGNYEQYMQLLIERFNPAAALGVMCRNTISINYKGDIYDCDFNQMLDLKVNSPFSHIDDYNHEVLQNRRIVTKMHCYGCTAGAGSSCGGTTV